MNNVSTKKTYDAILVAGQGESSYKVYRQHKAFLEIDGKCIINYVVECLQQVDSIDEIYIVGPEDRLRQTLEDAKIDLESPKRIHIVPQRSNLYLNVWHTFLQTIGQKEDSPELMHPENRDRAVLIVPCDSPLITPTEVEYFITHSDVENYDHILGLTAEENLEHFYPKDNKPGIKMAYLHLQEKSFRLNNLHLVKPIRIENRQYIQRMYEYRYQRNIKNFILFGLSLIGKDKTQHYRYYIGLQLGLLFASLGWNKLIDVIRNWTPKRSLERSISTIMNTRFMALEVPYPGAALDIDNDKDYEVMKIRFNEWRVYLEQLVSPTVSESENLQCVKLTHVTRGQTLNPGLTQS
jgi:molybdopterin-guanine dinucleotide biosynthesis protein A